MTSDIVEERSAEKLTDADFERLGAIAAAVFDDLFVRRPDTSGLYKGRTLLIALCQGSALHQVDGQQGIKDLDVWGFFGPPAERAFPCRSRWVRDFGPSHLGRHPDDVGFRGRRIDILGRSIGAHSDESGPNAVVRYLRARATGTAKHLSQRPVVGLWPDAVRGQVIWSGQTSAATSSSMT